ncbi:MAG: hypothetical protein R6U58_05830 [Bacteroidales bacterium]
MNYTTADLNNEDEVKKYAGDAERHLKRVDIFFNNAGIEGTVFPIDGGMTAK